MLLLFDTESYENSIITVSFYSSHSCCHQRHLSCFSQNAIDGFNAERVAGPASLGRTVSRCSRRRNRRANTCDVSRSSRTSPEQKKTTTPRFMFAIRCAAMDLTADLKEYDVWLNYPNTPSVLELITTRRQRLNSSRSSGARRSFVVASEDHSALQRLQLRAAM